ncbi:hypothetical protein D9M68_785370 [compost metagenome]
MRGLLGDDRNDLDARGPRAEHGNSLAGEVDALMGPATGVIGGPLEAGQALQFRSLGLGQNACTADQIAGLDGIALVGFNSP